ncbi:hypothetical protein [Pedobacter frigidisoli]|uniref:hypothetical protein n=1 Tax=Pedobacter frigidisoli TaxID=2530455 RepID=UPI002931D50B|nr:hypothetical protein [Pedobacter frigidisoli]
MNLAKFTSLYLILIGISVAFVATLPALFPNTLLFVSDFWLIFGFMAVITYLAYVLVNIGLKRNPQAGVMAIMGSIGVKMIFCMAFVLIYSIKAKGDGLLFILNFFSVYLLFTVFEMYCLLRNLRHQNLK